MEKARAMRISSNLPHDLWMEIINSAAYLYNRTPREAQGWKTLYEVFYTHLPETGNPIQGSHENSEEGSFRIPVIIKKPQLVHLQAYGCRAYAMTAEAQLKKKRKWKLDPRAYIGYLVGYDTTNIFRIWIPHKGEVISTRDVLFDEHTFFNGKSESLSQQMIAEMDSLVARVRLPEAQATNERLLEEDEEVLEPPHEDDEETGEEEEIADFNEQEDYELAKTMEEALLTLPPSEAGSTFHVQFPVNSTAQTEDSPCEACGQGVEDERFEDFQSVKISSTFHEAAVAGQQFKFHKRRLPQAPKTV